MMMNVNEWIITWFQNNSEVSLNEINKNLETNYLEQGWIDSLKFVSFVSELEENFKIRFSNDEFQNRGFATINGLIKIIEAKTNDHI